MARANPMYVPVGWDNDDEGEEINSRKFWETVCAIPSQPTLLLLNSSTFHPLSSGDSGKLIEIRAWEHKVSNVTTRDFQIVNLSDGRSTAPTNDDPSSGEST